MALEGEDLAADDSVNWHITPKLYQYQQLTGCGFALKDFRRYKDETTGGELVKLFARRGGKHPATAAQIATDPVPSASSSASCAEYPGRHPSASTDVIPSNLVQEPLPHSMQS